MLPMWLVRRGSAVLGAAALRGWSSLGPNTAVTTAVALQGILNRERKNPLLQISRDYVRPSPKKREVISSQLDDLSSTMLVKDYAKVPGIDKVDDVVKRLLSLEMASQAEKLKIKKDQLADKVRRGPSDSGSIEVQIAHLTAKIRAIKEHLQIHRKDKANYRKLLMSIDRRNVLLNNLRRTRYDAFEKVCKQLDIEYVIPPLYRRRATRRWLTKKAFCIKVFQEKQKLKAAEILKQRKQRANAAKEKSLPGEESQT
uniref:Small ribosomal subunit protein uS15m n=1 Tax=Salvator merianae TaxID=96440 RepID=A0A8D0CCN8_SALMN